MSFHECQKANFESYDPSVRSLLRQIWSQAPAAITQLPHDIHVGVCRDAHWCRRWRFLAAKFWEIMAGFATDLRGHIFCLLFCFRCTFCGMIKLTLIIKSCSKGRISSAWNQEFSTNKKKWSCILKIWHDFNSYFAGVSDSYRFDSCWIGMTDNRIRRFS